MGFRADPADQAAPLTRARGLAHDQRSARDRFFDFALAVPIPRRNAVILLSVARDGSPVKDVAAWAEILRGGRTVRAYFRPRRARERIFGRLEAMVDVTVFDLGR